MVKSGYRIALQLKYASMEAISSTVDVDKRFLMRGVVGVYSF